MIKGKTVFLRAMEPEDIDILYTYENDPEVWHVSNTYIPFSKHFLSQFIATSGNDLFVDKQLRLMIVLQKSKKCIGTLDFFEFDPMHLRAGIGILIEKSHREQGIATEAVQLAAEYAFNNLNLHQLFVHITDDNPASIRLFEKTGFEKTGIKKDWLCIMNNWKDVFFMQLLNKPNRK
jgi:diamine N-acetyltransferase